MPKKMTLLERANKIYPFGAYLESCGITDDEEIKSAARYQVDCINDGESVRWEDATPSEKRAMRMFVKKYC